MILQALTEYFETLSEQGKLARPGWSEAKISYVLYIGSDGELEQISSMKIEQPRGKKTVPVPQSFILPAPVKRAVNVAPNFLWDNSSYILGIDNKGKPERSLKCFDACRALHHRLLDGVDSPAARALLAFFGRWMPETAAGHPALREHGDDLLASANLMFRYNGAFVHEDPLIRQAWQNYYDTAEGGGPEMTCLITGRRGPAEPVHPAIKGVAGAQSSGAALVSFNAPAFCSYGHEQNLNAPVSKYAAFAYTSALNCLLSDREHVHHIGDTTVLFWARNGQTAYQNFVSRFMMGFPTDDADSPASYSAGDLADKVKQLCNGSPVSWDEKMLDPKMDFYILGLSPNAARLSVRFFLHNTFDGLLKNIQAHYERLKIVRPAFDKFETIPLWKLLRETVNQKARDKSPAPGLTGDTLRAIFTNTRYPAALLNGVTLRIRAESEVTRGRAAILKAYYIQNPHPDVPKEEVCTVPLNPASTNIPYNLGRLFAVLEKLQLDVNSEINTTIKDRYFNSASAAPSRVFPTLINLAQKHLRKLGGGPESIYNKRLTEIFSKLGETYPDRLNLAQQGSFQLGYYHQMQALYPTKEDKKNG